MNFWSLLLFRTGFDAKSVPWKVEIQLEAPPETQNQVREDNLAEERLR